MRHHPPMLLRNSAFSNLMVRIGAPADFIRRLPAPLQLATTNYLLGEGEETSSATLRLRGTEVAALVSGRYAPLDPEELLSCVRDALVRFRPPRQRARPRRRLRPRRQHAPYPPRRPRRREGGGRLPRR